MKESVNKTFMGLPGAIWCLMEGLTNGVLSVLLKLAYQYGIIVSICNLIRHITMLVGSYLFGKCCYQVNYDYRQYNTNVVKTIFLISFMKLICRSVDILAVDLLPVSVYMTINTCASPFFSGVIAYFKIGEKLSLSEWVGIMLGLTGILILTMP